jgi:CBS domain-containing protein
MNQGNKLLDCADDWMNREPITVLTSDSVHTIAKIMADQKIGCVLVMGRDKRTLFGKEDGKLEGIITDTDIVRKVVAQNRSPEKVKAQEIMTHPLKTIEPNYPMIEISRLMTDHKIKRLPVLNEDGMLKGIITISDVMYSMVKLGRLYDLGQLVRYVVKKEVKTENVVDVMLLKNWMHKEIVMMAPHQTILDAAKLMHEHKLGALPVVENEILQGIITDTDIVRKIAQVSFSPSTTLVDHVMTKKLICGNPQQTLMDAGAIMTQNKIKRIPILEEGKLVGIISVTDIINIMLQMNNISHAHKIITQMLYKGHADFF